VAVKLDDREERVPRAQLASSAIYQEAIARIPRDERPATTEARASLLASAHRIDMVVALPSLAATEAIH
jgi:hypothetical protein